MRVTIRVLALRCRFVAAGAAVRYRAIHDTEVEDIVAFDLALSRNQHDWFEILSGDIQELVRHEAADGPAFYRALDPCNQFNPGIEQTSRRAYWE